MAGAVVGEQGPGDLRERVERLRLEDVGVGEVVGGWGSGMQGFLEEGLGAPGEKSMKNSFWSLWHGLEGWEREGSFKMGRSQG